MTKNFDIFVEKLINSFEELPISRPYGFWISPEGRMYSVFNMDHFGEARNIINFFETRLKDVHEKDKGNIKDFLIRKGFLRTVFMGDEMLIDNNYYDYEQGKYIIVPPKPKADKTAKDIAIFYNYRPVYTSID